ncbi:ATP-dependent endonuclease [uncultured Aquimarina sp.]|uniref:ATP-dependent nuclease n=1 Tax=uncultured Aquimarina sp. TaxID=575652 RepID=UPI00261FE7B9|nr:ATP-dependent endonuclease [uncultured Aquimarina sp.]
MKIKKIKIENYKLLKSFSIDLEDVMSLVIGKNNTGKTSLLTLMDKFLKGSSKFSIDDFNLDFKKELIDLINKPISKEDLYKPLGIKLKLFIEYNETDSLENISRLMMNLDPDNKFIVLGYEYHLTFNALERIKVKYLDFEENEKTKKSAKPEYIEKDISYFLKKYQEDYFEPTRKSIEYNIDEGTENDDNFIDLEKEKIPTKQVIHFNYISAKRSVTNNEKNKTLSTQTSEIYKETEKTDVQNERIEEFKEQLSTTDTVLTDIYATLFKDVIEKVRKFGGVKSDDSTIKIESTLQHRELLEGNTTVMYKHNDNTLPEYNNGLGYMNLISMIFQIEILIQVFKKGKEEKPADINLLFIEEPEAHTHPQMQYIFIKNIKSILNEGIKREDGNNRELQTVITTHSSHIVSESVFDDIKYLKRDGENSVISKNLKSLEKEYIDNGEEESYRFLKQYLTLNRSELFFAEKAILIEGDTERLLLPAMMKKIDQECTSNQLLSQNISIVEVGAHSQIFEKFIDFIDLKKCLIITDIDSNYDELKLENDGVTPKKHGNGKDKMKTIKCTPNNPKANYTSNNSLIFSHKKSNDLNYYKNLSFGWKILRKNRKKEWVSNRKGKLLLAYQIEEDGYYARSFEDAFFKINRDFILDNTFPSLTPKWVKKYRNMEIDEFTLAEKAIEKKPPFAIEVLLNSKMSSDGKKQFINWNTPLYISEGLLWLQKD